MFRFICGIAATVVALLVIEIEPANAVTYNYVATPYSQLTTNTFNQMYAGTAATASLVLTEQLPPSTTTEVLRFSSSLTGSANVHALSPLFVEMELFTGAQSLFAFATGSQSPHYPTALANASLAIISLTTDSAGAIARWLFRFDFGSRNDSGSFTSSEAGEYASYGFGPFFYTAASSEGGSWTVATVPVPAALWLLLSSLAVLAGFGKIRRLSTPSWLYRHPC